MSSPNHGTDIIQILLLLLLPSFLTRDPLMLALQDLQFNGNRLTRVPTAALAGPESLQNLQLQDNLIGKQSKPLYFFSTLVQRYDFLKR